MCGASYYVLSVILGQQVDRKLSGIYYSSETLYGAQRNCGTSKNILFLSLFVVIISYIVYSKVQMTLYTPPS